MTELQIKYHGLREEMRHNRSVERETSRSNLAKERETHRSNTENEYEANRSNKAKEHENFRHNTETEKENRRHNRNAEAAQTLAAAGTFLRGASSAVSAGTDVAKTVATKGLNGLSGSSKASPFASGGFGDDTAYGPVDITDIIN